MIIEHMNPNVIFDIGLKRCRSMMIRHSITSSEVLRSVNIWGETVNDAMEATGMARNGTEVEVVTLPECDICKYENGKPLIKAHYDAKTHDGRWANVCQDHFVSDTPQQLGVGRGQRLVLKKPLTEVHTERELAELRNNHSAVPETDPS